jgi:hypothetical protein
MKELREITILKEGNVQITNQRAIIGAKTYALSKMAYVRVHVDEPKLFLPVFYMLIASVCWLWSPYPTWKTIHVF